MSQGFQPRGRSHIYSPPSGDGRDRHLDRITEYASSLFAEPQYSLPQIFTPSSINWNQDGLPGELGQVTHDPCPYVGLDEFDRTILGHPQPVYHPQGIRGFSSGSSGSTAHRLSLPLNANATRPSRVLGDASHHFRPFISREPEYKSPFQSTPHHHDDESLEIDCTSAIQRAQLPSESSPQAFHLQLPVQPNPARFEPSQPPPFAQPVFSRNGAQRVGKLQLGTQLFTPPCHKEKTTPPVNSSLTGSSPSNAGHSSPSNRIILERQKQAAKRSQLVPRWNQKAPSEFDHASGLPPVVNNTRLVDPRQSLPSTFHDIFPFQLFNAVQSRCLPLVYGTDDNVVVSAPTGSGKTAILEMAICKLVLSQGERNFKIVYQAPTKSLCSEKAREWRTKFSHMNLQCVELTGDTSQAEAHRVGNASIIVTTPEKWDSVTRKWKDHRRLLELVRLVLIDEVHILKDTRGATLEAVVSRMKTIGANIRFVAISATVPNIDDVAKWLGRDHQNQLEPAKYEVFGEELRPVKLQRYVYGYEGVLNDFIFEQALDEKLILLLGKHTERRPIMVFCFTRRSCERTARSLAEWWSTCGADDRPWPPPHNRIPVLSRDLQEIVRYGVAFHHAGLDARDRTEIQTSFLSGQLHVICCTSTLAVGVNLPCHTVVLKGTSHYTDDGPQEYSDLEVMQMLGRAGRPQFDKTATAIIMTRLANTQRYKKLVSGEERLESTLHRNLLEHLNSEIGLGTIQDIQTAKKWINGTFLSVRLRQCPSLYNIDDLQSDTGAEEQMEEWCERDVKLLQDNGLVTKHIPLVCTEYGQAMSRYMIQFETMRLLLSIPRAASIEEMLTVICKAVEFKDFRFKPTERAVFRELNKSPLILHPIRETLTLTWHKVFMIVQIYLGGVDLPADKDTNLIRHDLAREKRMVFDRLKRLIRCVIDCKAFEGDGSGTKAALELSRSIAAQAWENKPAQLSQIPGFGPVAVRKWISHGVCTVLGVADKSFLDIERIASRNPPYGRDVQKILENFPRLTLKADLIESRAPDLESHDPVSVTIKVRLGHRNTKAVPSWKDRIPALTFIALTSDGNLAYFWRGNIKKLDKPNGLDVKFPVALTAPNQTILCHFSCEEIVGTQVTKTLEPNIPASVFRSIRCQATQPTVSKSDIISTERDYEEISDEAMLEALETSRPTNLEPYRQSPVPLGTDEEDFPLIDELLSQGDASAEAERPKMENGRYACNHHCNNGGLTRLGKRCSHKCCRDGVDRYRPPKPLKSGNLVSVSKNENSAGPDSKLPQAPGNSKRQNIKNGNSSRATPNMELRGDARIDTKDRDRSPHHEIPKAKRTYSSEHIRTPKRAKGVHLSSPSGFLSDIEYVDLCNVGDSSAISPARKTRVRATAQNHRQKLLLLHEEVSSNGIISPRLTKSYKAKSIPLDGNQRNGTSNDMGGNTAAPNTNDIHMTAEDDPFSDKYDEMSDLPDLNEIFGSKKDHEQLGSRDVALPRIAMEVDETLYPGVVHTLKESLDYG
ncbi:hypothetical protein F5Y14DRAFT_255347 [Nemania sp. NC0429]|nr:hypothetical protein F5Y14DRAFT_255347 [Nemania sp. NC0429]